MFTMELAEYVICVDHQYDYIYKLRFIGGVDRKYQ